MPKTFTTTVSPIPTDARVLHLEQLLAVSRSQAVGVVVMSWAWMLAEESEGVVSLPVTILDKVVDIEGAGQALVDAGLVGVEPAGLVLPLGVRQAADRAQHQGESADDRRRRQQRDRTTKFRRRNKLTSPPQASRLKASPPTAEALSTSCKPRPLGKVEGRTIMLLYRRDGVPFYKLQGASPKDFTGTVTDPDNPSLADAFVALLSTMRRDGSKGGLDGPDKFRPTMEQMVAAARLERERREASVADAARREEVNGALAEAAAEDQDDHDQCGPERDTVTPLSRSERDTVTCNAPVTLAGSESVNGSPCHDRDLGAVSEGLNCNAPRHDTAPSSSSSSVFFGIEEENTTTTTRGVAAVQRDTDDILEGFVRDDILDTFVEPPPSPERAKQMALCERFAKALNTSVDAVSYQLREEPALLATRLRVAGIDTKTGEPFASGGTASSVMVPAVMVRPPDTADDQRGSMVESLLRHRA